MTFGEFKMETATDGCRQKLIWSYVWRFMRTGKENRGYRGMGWVMGDAFEIRWASPNSRMRQKIGERKAERLT